MAQALRPTIAAVLAFLLLVALLLAALVLVVPGENRGSVRFSYSFPSAQQGIYPSGMPFDTSNIVHPKIVETVYNKHQVAELGITLSDFARSITILPFSPQSSSTRTRYSNQLVDRRLTLAERLSLEREFQAELLREARGGAEISIVLRTRRPTSTDFLRKLALAIVQEWSHDARTRLNVLGVQVDAVGNELLPESGLNIARELKIVQALDRLQDRINTLSSVKAINSLRDPVSGKSIADVQMQLDDSWLGLLNILADAWSSDNEIRKAAAAAAVTPIDAARKSKEIIGRAEVLKDTIYKITQEARQFVVAEGRSGDRASSTPQISDAFIDKLIQMALKSTLNEQVQKLSAEEVDLRKQASDLTIGRLNQVKKVVWDILGKSSTGLPAQQKEPLNKLSASLNDLWGALLRIKDVSDSQSTGANSLLFIPYDLKSTDDGYHHWAASRQSIAFAVASAIIFGILAFLLLSLRHYRRLGKQA